GGAGEQARQGALAGARRPDEQAGRPVLQPPAEQLVELLDAALGRLEILVLRLVVPTQPRVHHQPAGADAEVVVAAVVGQTADLDDAKVAADLAVVRRRLLQVDDAGGGPGDLASGGR